MSEKIEESLSRDMKPIGLLMIEHRLIERMISILKEASEEAEEAQKIDPWLVRSGINFIRFYADRTHHGKEEDILFRDLEDKDTDKKHSEIMSELIEEHKWGREKVGQLEDALEKYRSGNKDAFGKIIEIIKALTDFYPKHIEKEDKHFFMEVMEYFSENEQESMLEAMRDFDSKVIHINYETIVSMLEDDVK